MSLKVICFISGRGSNLRSLIKESEHYEIIGVLSDKPEAPGLQFAADNGIPTVTVSKAECSSKREQKEKLYEKAREFNPDLILLAGYMQIVEPGFIFEFKNRIINIHPSFLPSFPGLNTHKQALEAGVKEHGCTVHIAIPEVDAGPIIVQAKCDVEDGDDENTLGARVLEWEHKIFPWAINGIGSKNIQIDDKGGVVFSDSAKKEAKDLGFILP